MSKRYGYFGPKGTNSEEALYLYLGTNETEALPYNGIEHVIGAIHKGEITHGLIPIENSIEGTVNLTLDLLANETILKIVGEVTLPIRHHLLVKSGISHEKITRIISHPQALAQCRKYLSNRFPGIEVLPVDSTAEAARIISEDNGTVAAIGSIKAAQYYKLNILEQDIHDCKENRTRFVIISKEVDVIPERAKTSLVISITDRPGGLYEILKEFALAHINLTKIESRPAKKNLGDYLFFIDLIGHPQDAGIKKCLEAIQDMAASFTLLGTYPTWGNKCPEETVNTYANYGKQLTIEELRQNIDIIDYQIVELLAKRTQIVSLIGSLKSNSTAIRDKSREEEVLVKVKKIAQKKGVDPKLLEQIYEYLFDYFVKLQEFQTASSVYVRHKN